MTCEISEDVYTKAEVVHEVERFLKNYFIERDYGPGVDKLLIGVICVWKVADDFFKERHKFNRVKKLLSLDIKLDHERVSIADVPEIKRHIADKLMNIPSVIRGKNVKNFDIDAFEKDLRDCLDRIV